MEDAKYLTIDEIIEIHDKLIENFGGESGISNRGNLEFILSKMRIPKDIYRKAAVLLIGIIESHVFVDENKRTALQCLDDFLDINEKNFKIKQV